ncbi:hypothetical protein ABIC10_008195 [Bradyrhizobium sp. S3.2.12]
MSGLLFTPKQPASVRVSHEELTENRAFIDGANLYATVKNLGFDIDYKRLLREFQSHGTLLRAPRP